MVTCTPDTHIAEEIQKFLDGPLTRKQIQQFLGIIQYLRKFIPRVAQMTRPLQLMLKKDVDSWIEKQTQAVKKLKTATQNLSALVIPSTGQRILQTNVSDKYWNVVLPEDKNGHRHICGYKNGSFKESETHYHSTFKEILAVKYGIQKFKFHLAAYHFTVVMDCSSFPKILQFKRKMLPHTQLLRLAEWFSKYTFTVEYIKGTKNLILYMLTRPPKTQTLLLPLILMASSSNLPPPDQDFLTDDLPSLAQEMVLNHTLDLQAKNKLFSLQDYLLLNYDMSSLCFQSLGIHPKYPFIHLFTFKPSRLFPKELYLFLWYFCHLYHIAIEFPTDCFLSNLLRTSWPADFWYYILKFLTWFHNPTQWISILQHEKSKWPHPQPC